MRTALTWNGFVPGLILVAAMAAYVVYLIRKADRKTEAVHRMKSII